MTDFSTRLVEERKRLGLNQTEFGELGSVSKDAQFNYEKGSRRPDTAYLEAIARHGVDVAYLLTGVRMPLSPSAATGGGGSPLAEDGVPRMVTKEQAALLDNYEHADEEGRAAARRVLSSLAESGRKAA